MLSTRKGHASTAIKKQTVNKVEVKKEPVKIEEPKQKEKTKEESSLNYKEIIILTGIVVVNIWGFNKELQYENGQSIEIYLEQKADIAKIK